MGKWILLHALGALLAVGGIIWGTDVTTGVTAGPGAALMFVGFCVCGMAFGGYMYQLSLPVYVSLPVKET